MSEADQSHLPQRYRFIASAVDEALRSGFVLNHDPPTAQHIEQWLRSLSSEWQVCDLEELHESDEVNAGALHSCLASGFVEIRFDVTALDASMARSAVFGVRATGSYHEELTRKLHEAWPECHASQQTGWSIRLTAPGMGAKIDVESGEPNRARRACQQAFYLKCHPRVLCKLKGTPQDTSAPSAVAMAQANPVINVTTPAPVVNLTVEQSAPPQPNDDSNGSEGFLSHQELCSRFGIESNKKREAFRKALDRWRHANPGSPGFVEHEISGPNNSSFSYSISAVQHLVDRYRD